jgi:hypothetical protein
LLEPGDDLVQDLFEGHDAPSTCRFALWCSVPAVQHTKIAEDTPWMGEERHLSRII